MIDQESKTRNDNVVFSSTDKTVSRVGDLFEVELSPRVRKIAAFIATALAAEDGRLTQQLKNVHPLLGRYADKVALLGQEEGATARTILDYQRQPVLEIEVSDREDEQVHLECYRFAGGKRIFDHAISFLGDPDQGNATIKMEGSTDDQYAFFEPVDGPELDYMTITFTGASPQLPPKYQVKVNYIPLPQPNPTV